jgi:hypothetical protein
VAAGNTPTPKAGDASFTNYPKNNNPFDTKDAAGEVSIGADWSSDTAKARTPSCSRTRIRRPIGWTSPIQIMPRHRPPPVDQRDVRHAKRHVRSIGYQDHPFASDPGYPSATVTGYPTVTTLRRLIVSQLYTVCSDLAFTDDDGSTYAGDGLPHSSRGGPPDDRRRPVPRHHTPTLHPLYPHAIYYCSQNITDARCGRSDDGGLTLGRRCRCTP